MEFKELLSRLERVFKDRLASIIENPSFPAMFVLLDTRSDYHNRYENFYSSVEAVVDPFFLVFKMVIISIILWRGSNSRCYKNTYVV